MKIRFFRFFPTMMNVTSAVDTSVVPGDAIEKALHAAGALLLTVLVGFVAAAVGLVPARSAQGKPAVQQFFFWGANEQQHMC